MIDCSAWAAAITTTAIINCTEVLTTPVTTITTTIRSLIDHGTQKWPTERILCARARNSASENPKELHAKREKKH